MRQRLWNITVGLFHLSGRRVSWLGLSITSGTITTWSQPSPLSKNSCQYLVLVPGCPCSAQITCKQESRVAPCSALTLWPAERPAQHLVVVVVVVAKAPSRPCQQNASSPGWNQPSLDPWNSVDCPPQHRKQSAPPGPRTSAFILIGTFL